MTILYIDQLTVNAGRGGENILQGISCELQAGEILSVIGPNGAGKSTLLKCIAGDLAPSSGSITLHGIAAEGIERAKQLAVLPQLSLLNFPYRVEEVVQLGRTPHSTGLDVDREVVSQCMAAMDIENLAGRRYTTLSGGERQRVQLARVIAQIWPASPTHDTPVLLLLDEPVTALDLGHQQILMHALQQLAGNNVAIMMVLHDINLAARYSGKILALRDAECMAYGSPSSVLQAGTIESLFNTRVTVMQHPNEDLPVIVNV